MLLLNEMQAVGHENSIHARQAESRTPQVTKNFVDCDSVMLFGNRAQGLLVEVDSEYLAATNESLCKRHREEAVSATQIAPGLRFWPVENWILDQSCRLVTLHFDLPQPRLEALLEHTREGILRWRRASQDQASSADQFSHRDRQECSSCTGDPMRPANCEATLVEKLPLFPPVPSADRSQFRAFKTSER